MNRPFSEDILAQNIQDAFTLLHNGQTDRASTAAKAILAQNPDALAATDILGLIAQKKQDYAQAETLYIKALEIHPDKSIVPFRLGECARAQGELEKALPYYEKACALNPKDPGMLTALGSCLQDLKRPEEAQFPLKKALTIRDDFFPAHLTLANSYRDLGQLKEAIAHTNRALEIEPNSPEALCNVGSYREMLQDFEEAAAHYKKAMEFAPKNPTIRSNLCTVLEKMNRLDEAEFFLQSAPEEIKNNQTLLIAHARILRRQKKYDQALDLLKNNNINEIKNPRESVMKNYEIGKIHDCLKNYDAAFSAIKKAKALQRTQPEFKNRNKNEIFEEIESDQKRFTKDWVESWSTSPPYIGTPPVMLVGFPRSGTTLIDRILHAHPMTCVMEERPVADIMAQTLRSLPDISRLDTLEIAQLQSEYFMRAERYIDIENGKTLIDKMPLNMTLLGPMNRIFPDLKVIVVLRHPCDCILSCLMQHFLPNKGMLPLIELESAVQLYIKAFDLLAQYQEVLPHLKIHFVRYEDLVENTEKQARNMLDFIGLEWNKNVLAYHENKKGRPVTSASYAQVNQPIYKNSLYRWKNYESHLAPALPALSPYIEKFGYHSNT